jgi:hypothetical protein
MFFRCLPLEVSGADGTPTRLITLDAFGGPQKSLVQVVKCVTGPRAAPG